ncbi:PucR family transcriptional regulator [Allokutzneria albata]|uniref:PucR C-terminal helix-turn-helix domain-containing protein n=1 Tax=Allokutzneria albata TaxID=211114 RepID=A0A1G9RSG4_ALLAB|nr:helix-turn-helix domain-containing protein [Allokutzneria albata]SDM26156.1 PucR C-terminal helix-turn-helix domain-containing protein [Allokutzneria albata]
MSRKDVVEQLSVAELVQFGPLGQAKVFAGEELDRQVSGVVLVAELEEIRQCEPHSAVVLHGTAAQGAWALESALRLAWERNASCVIAPSDIAVGNPTAQLAERLRVPLFVVADPARHALELSAAVADTDAARARLTARCAVLFGERGTLRDIVGVINTEVPGVQVALIAEDGHVLAGRAAADHAEGRRRVEVHVPGPDGRPWARLVGQLAAWSPSWALTVRTVLGLARAPLAACVGRAWLRPVHQAASDRVLLELLLGEDGDAEAARAAGWSVDGNHIAVFLQVREADNADPEATTPRVIAAWQEAFPHLPLIPRGEGWVSWWTGAEGPEAIAGLLRPHLLATRPVQLAAGVGLPGEGIAGLRRSVDEARLAAAVAGRRDGETVELFGALGPRAVLACIPVPDVAAAARVALADLLAAPDADVLLTALVALLDCAGSTGQAAARLGVHRNTVLSRIERIRARGIDLDSPEQRLALHLACYSLLSAH